MTADSHSTPRIAFRAALILSATFIVGALVGSSTDRVLNARQAQTRTTDQQRDTARKVDIKVVASDSTLLRKRIVISLQQPTTGAYSQLSLTPQQAERIAALLLRQRQRTDSLYGLMMPQITQLGLDTRARIDSLLSPAQRQRFRDNLARQKPPAKVLNDDRLRMALPPFKDSPTSAVKRQVPGNRLDSIKRVIVKKGAQDSTKMRTLDSMKRQMIRKEPVKRVDTTLTGVSKGGI